MTEPHLFWTVFSAVLGAIILGSSPARAMTGAELLQADANFTEGYIFGTAESIVTFTDGSAEDMALVMHRRNCLIDSKIMSGDLRESVLQFIRNNPEKLSQPAPSTVLDFIAKMCGPPR